MPLYYNMTLQNTTGHSIPLRFDTNLNIPFIDKPSDYDVSIVRFVLPNFENPIMIYKDTATLENGTTVSINNMKMSYNGNTVTKHVAYIPQTSNVTTQSIWDIQHCILMLNTTISSLYTDLNAIATLPTSDMPYFTYSETTKLISFTANKNYFASSLSTPIVISVDLSLLAWLYGFPLYGHTPDIYGVPTTYDFLVRDLHNNTVNTNYFVMTQQAPSFDRMRDFDRIVITTNLPIQSEYLGTSSTMPIIQDYYPADMSIDQYYNNIVYNAVVPYRQTKLISDVPFYSMKFDCYAADIAGNLTPMILQTNNAANLKLMFSKHSENNYG